jgi:hypothetical protein
MAILWWYAGAEEMSNSARNPQLNLPSLMFIAFGRV